MRPGKCMGLPVGRGNLKMADYGPVGFWSWDQMNKGSRLSVRSLYFELEIVSATT